MIMVLFQVKRLSDNLVFDVLCSWTEFNKQVFMIASVNDGVLEKISKDVLILRYRYIMR